MSSKNETQARINLMASLNALPITPSDARNVEGLLDAYIYNVRATCDKAAEEACDSARERGRESGYEDGVEDGKAAAFGAAGLSGQVAINTREALRRLEYEAVDPYQSRAWRVLADAVEG